MGKEKGATPSRRLPSRSGRASFDGDPKDEGAPNGEVVPAQGASETEKTQEQEQPGSEDSRNSASGAENGAGPPGTEEPSPKPVTSRGRGRPRKKPLESPPQVKAEEANMEVAATAAAAAAASPRTDGSSPASSPRAGGSSPRAVGGWETARTPVVATKKEAAAQADGGGNESDEWSDHDEVHDLPDEIKAQFGQVVWAKFGRSPPWPALVWDPRFLEKNKAGRDVARQAYAALGKSHLVRFYDKRPSYACAPYKSIKPFDIAELPTHLKGCSTAKQKENFRECAQMAVEAARLSRSGRLAEIHAVGRFTGKKKPTKSKRAPKAPQEKEEQEGSSKPSQPASSVSKAAAEPPKKRGRGRPRKTPLPAQPPVRELDEDAPSPVSSPGEEYELPVPEASEDQEGRGEGGEDGGGEEEDGGGEEEMDVDDDDEGGGDDDDEEEYTMDGEPEEDEDDKLSDEDFVAAKGGSGSSRKSKGRVRPRKSGGDGSDGEGGGRGRKKKPKRRRPASPSPSDGAGSDGGGGGDVSSGGEKATGSSGGNNAKKAKHGGMVPGQAKARALAVVRNFVASLPPVEYGRDEGWIASKEEARAAASSKGGGSGGGNKRERAAGGGGGGGGEKGEKKPKKMKASSREEREREERERKDRLSQMKSSPEPIWKQHRRIKEEKEKEKQKEKSSSGTSGGSESSAGNKSSSAGGGNRESQVQTGRKLTQRLGKASTEGKFNKDEVLEVLRKLGELEPSRELLQQSGCGKAVASARKYFFGGQVKHNDKDVATAASNLRSRWMEALAGGSAGGGGGGKSSSAPPAPRSSSSNSTPPSASASAAVSRSASAPSAIGGSGSGGEASSSSADKKPPSLERTSSTKKPVSQESPRARSPKVEAGEAVAGREVKRENGGRASPREGGRYGGGGGRDEEKAAAEVIAAVKKEAKKQVAPAAAAAAPAAVKMPAAVAMNEPRRRAMGMLMSVLGTTAQAMERCTAIEEELHQSQGREINKEYLRRLRTAVFSMEGSECQRLRDKVMSEMVLPRDFVSKSCEELRALAGLV